MADCHAMATTGIVVPLPSIPIFGRISSKSIYCKRLGSVMAGVTAKKGNLSVTAYRGDAKTLLAFNLAKQSAKNLPRFTIQCQPGDKPASSLFNQLQFQTPPARAQTAKDP